MDKKFSDDTRLLYVTTGYLLELLISNPKALEQKFTHLILDEVHDRDIDNDILLLFIRILLIHKSKIKLILMSATLDPQALVEYFLPYAINGVVPVINCPHRTFRVKKLYLEQIEARLEHYEGIEFDLAEPTVDERQCIILVKLLDYIDRREVKKKFQH
jgi:ATP-dependent RNA helicase DHX57